MLAQLAARLRARTATSGEGGEADEEGTHIVLDDNCNVSFNAVKEEWSGLTACR